MLLLSGDAAAELQQEQEQQWAGPGRQQIGTQQLVSQLSVTGVSVAVMSRRLPQAHLDHPDPAASTITAAAAGVPTAGVADSRSGALGNMPAASASASAAAQAGMCQRAGAAATTDLGAALAAEGWQDKFVLLRQWQCSVGLYAPGGNSSINSSTMSHKKAAVGRAAPAAENIAGQQQQQQPPPQAPCAIFVHYTTAGVREVRATARGLVAQVSSRSHECIQDMLVMLLSGLTVLEHLSCPQHGTIPWHDPPHLLLAAASGTLGLAFVQAYTLCLC